MRGIGNPLFVASLAAFTLLSLASGLQLSHGLDRMVVQTAQSHASEVLDVVAEILSLPGSAVICGILLLGLIVGLFVKGYKRLAVGLLFAFAGTGLLEISMKFLVPQVPISMETLRVTGQAPLVEFTTPYPYPSGHMLRSTLVLGAMFALWKNGLLRTLVVLTLAGVAWSLVYLGVHWLSDVIGGALLGIVGLAWTFENSSGKENTWRSR